MAKNVSNKTIDNVTIRFAGDSGDGMQLSGGRFTQTSAVVGNDLSTLPDFPAEIRAPAGSLAGVSSFQIHFSSQEIHTPGEKPDVLVAMNPAALKVHLKDLVPGGTLIVNKNAFTKKNLTLAGYEDDPTEDGSLVDYYSTHFIEMGKLVTNACEGIDIPSKMVDRTKNLCALGVLFWMYDRPLEPTIDWLNQKFKQYGVVNKDLATLKVRMDIIPVSLAIAQAAKETGWGTSRFAIDGNALFGQWTWSGEGIKPAGADVDATYKVMKFNVLKASVRAYQRNLNTHSSYKKFRFIRAQLRDDNKKLDSLKLAEYLDNYAQTGTEYTKVLKQIIQQNQLKDFDEVKLLPLSVKYENII